MKCCFINLDEARVRRAAMEAAFDALETGDWELVRFPAIDAAAMADVPGKLSAREKACFASHRGAIAASLDDEQPVLVVEDDMRFAAGCFQVLAERLPNHLDWDILYLECLPVDVEVILRLARWRRHLADEQRFRYVRLDRVTYAGATAYVVNGRAKAKVAGLLAEAGPLDTPYDIHLRNLAHDGRLNAYAIFPFLAHMGPLAETSQVQPDAAGEMDFVLNTLRRLLALERDVDACRRATEHILHDLCDEDARMFGAIFAGLLSPRVPDVR